MATHTVTIRDVAERAGVSSMTVTRALRGDAHVSEATRETVLQAARKLGYRYNPAVSGVLTAIRRQRVADYRGKIAWLHVGDREHSMKRVPWERPLYDGVCRRAAECDYLLETIWLDGLTHSDMGREQLTRVLLARGIQGAVIRGWHPSLDGLDWERFACATSSVASLSQPIHMAGADLLHGVRESFRRLHRHGCRRIGLIIHDLSDDTKPSIQRAGFLMEMSALPSGDRLPILRLPFRRRPEAHRELYRKWLLRHRPNAVICGDEYILGWTREMGIAVPGQLSLAHLGRHAYLTQWAGIDQHEDQIGAALVDLVVGQINRNEFGLPPFRKQVLIQGTWVDGPTLGPPR